MTPQTLTVVRWALTLIAGILASRGIISKETQDYLAGPETRAAVAAVAAAATLVWGLWSRRPHGIIKDAAALPQVDAVVVKPKTAGEIPVDNVVSTMEEAEKVAPAIAHRARKPAVQPTAH